MSHILVDFADPLLKAIKNYDAREKALSLAILAWNLSLEKADEREKRISEFLHEIKDTDHEKMRELLHLLVKRKLERFAAWRYQIVGFQLEQQGEKMKIKIDAHPI
jgi:hypothetical protein